MRRVWRTLFWTFAICIAAFVVSWIIFMPNKSERGAWLHPGSGNIISLGTIRAELYNQTAVGCTKTMSFPAHMGLVQMLEGVKVAVEGDTLDLIIDTTIEDAKYDRMDALPAACTEAGDSSPHAVFETMWAAMEENYPFFDLYGVDWNERRALSPAPGESMTDEALYALMQEALTGLDDGHIQLLAGELGFFSPSVAPKWMPEPELSRIQLNQTARENFGIPLFQSHLGAIDYGLRDDGLGYILIGGMWTDPGITQSETGAAAIAFAEIARDLKDAKGLVIDIRYNPGGSDGIPLTYAGFFTQEPQVVINKRTKAGSGWVDQAEASITPASQDSQLAQPVVLLISDLTGSAAEIFTMAMRELPNVTVMGEPTGGGLSDIHGITLPNGWRFGMSHQEYRTNSGELFEAIGVPPDILFEIDGEALKRGEDPLLQAAIDYLNEG